MRRISNAVLVALINAALIGTPAMAAPASSPLAPIGVVLQAQNNKALTDVKFDGATVYEGDRLQTDENESIRVRIGGPQLFLRPSTTTQVHALPNGFSAELAGGSVVASAAAGQAFQVLADGATIRPAASEPTVGEVTRVNANEVLISSSRGALEVTLGDEVKTVEPGTSYRMEVDSEDSSGPGSQGVGPMHTGRRRRLAMYLIAGGAAAGTGIIVWRALVSPNHN